MVELNEKLIEQTEQMVDEFNNDTIEELKVDELLDVSDEEILASLSTLESSNDSSAMTVKNLKSKTKKSTTQLADEIVRAYLADKSDENWKNLQEFFWYGIKQFAFKFTQNWDDAYDMTIETFIRALENMDSYNPDKAKFSTWLWTICRNNCLYFLNQKKKIPTVDNDLSDIYDSELLSNSYSQDLNSKEFKIESGAKVQSLESEDIYKELYNVSICEMANIGGIGGKILHMKLVDDMKIREIAKQLNMNESTVKNYLYKSKENLSRILRINHKELYEMYIDSKADEDNLYA